MPTYAPVYTKPHKNEILVSIFPMKIDIHSELCILPSKLNTATQTLPQSANNQARCFESANLSLRFSYFEKETAKCEKSRQSTNDINLLLIYKIK